MPTDDPTTEAVRAPDRLAALRATDLLDTAPEEAFDRYGRIAERYLDVQRVRISLVDENRQFFKSCFSADGEPEDDEREGPLSHSFCKHVVAERAPLVIEDAREDERVAGNPAIEENGVVAYLGFPLTTLEGHVLGSFCAISDVPHAWTDEEIAFMEDLASVVTDEVRHRREARTRFGLAKEAADVGFFTWDVNEDRMATDAYTARAFGLAPEIAAAGVPLETFLSGVRETAREQARAELEQAVREGDDFRAEYPTVDIDGRARWMEVRGRAEQSADGTGQRASHFPGAVTDVTDHQEATRERERLATIVEQSADLIAYADMDGELIFVNQAGWRMVGLDDEADALQHNLRDFFFPDRQGWVEDTLLPQVENGERWQGEVELRHFQTGAPVLVDLDFFSTPDPAAQAPAGLVLVADDLSEREAARRRQEKAELAQTAAERANRAKSQFIANVSHELRTPLNAIISYSELLIEEGEEEGTIPDLALEDLGKIRQAGGHLLELINDVLDLSKIEAGEMSLYLENFEVALMIEAVADTIRSAVSENDNELVVECADDVGRMHSDLTKVRQGLFNLLSNAAKFTESGTVTLRAARREEFGADWLIFEIEDTGIGMSEEQMERVFDEFEQAERSTTRNYGGTGLGLTITKQLTEMLGGDVQFESEENVGTHFTIRLPAVTEDPEAETPLEEAPGERVADGEPGHAASHADTVLVIEDSVDARDILTRYLGEEGLRVETASDGKEGLEKARALQPVLITLDIMMPGTDGWAVLSELKEDPKLRDTPVVVVSFAGDENMAYTLGAVDYLPKPVNRERLVEIIGRHRPTETSEDCTILIVEDDEVTREATRRTLGDKGCTLLEAEHGQAALDLLDHPDQPRPTLILLDLMMPVMDGLDFLAALREREDGRDIPVIVLTAKELTSEDRRRISGRVKQVVQKGRHSRQKLLDAVRERLPAAREASSS